MAIRIAGIQVQLKAKPFFIVLKGLIATMPSHLHSELINAIPDNPEIGDFYMLPKIHKPGNPGRPIITGINTLTEHISGLVENMLKPLVMNTASFLQDTTDFLNKLNNIHNYHLIHF